MNMSRILLDEQQGVEISQSRRAYSSTAGFHARLALDCKTKRDAYRLRHQSYHAKGYIDARPRAEFSDSYDRIEGNTTIVVYSRDQPIGSVRVCQSGPGAGPELPVAKVFPDEITALMRPDGRATELNRLVRHPDHADSTGLVFILFRMATFVIRQQPPDFLASCVRPNHAGFYKRMRFEQVAGPRAYPDLNFPTNLLVCPRASLEQISRTIPVLTTDAATDARYAQMMHGATVPVFGDE